MGRLKKVGMPLAAMAALYSGTAEAQEFQDRSPQLMIFRTVAEREPFLENALKRTSIVLSNTLFTGVQSALNGNNFWDGIKKSIGIHAGAEAVFALTNEASGTWADYLPVNTIVGYVRNSMAANVATDQALCNDIRGPLYGLNVRYDCGNWSVTGIDGRTVLGTLTRVVDGNKFEPLRTLGTGLPTFSYEFGTGPYGKKVKGTNHPPNANYYLGTIAYMNTDSLKASHEYSYEGVVNGISSSTSEYERAWDITNTNVTMTDVELGERLHHEERHHLLEGLLDEYVRKSLDRGIDFYKKIGLLEIEFYLSPMKALIMAQKLTDVTHDQLISEIPSILENRVEWVDTDPVSALLYNK